MVWGDMQGAGPVTAPARMFTATTRITAGGLLCAAEKPPRGEWRA